MIADMLNSKTLNPIVTKMCNGRKKLYIYVVLITQCCSAVPKSIRVG